MTPVAKTEAWALAPASPAFSPSLRKRQRRRATWRRRRTVLLFMSPWIVGFSIFFGYPILYTAYLSFTHYNLISPPKWVGLRNFHYLFTQDPFFRPALKNTLWIMTIMVPLQVIFAFGIALILASARRGIGIFRTIFYLPALAPPVAATLAFVYIFNPGSGPVNLILGKLGISGPLWFNDPRWAKPALTLLAIWGVGNLMIIFMASILDVPRHLQESAEIDGAGPFQRLIYVTLPSISPVILFAVVISVIAGLQYFTQAYVASTIASGNATQAGDQPIYALGYPQNSTLFLPVLLFSQGLRSFQMGYGSAIALLILVASFAVTLIIVGGSRRWVHYQGGR